MFGFGGADKKGGRGSSAINCLSLHPPPPAHSTTEVTDRDWIWADNPCNSRLVLSLGRSEEHTELNEGD